MPALMSLSLTWETSMTATLTPTRTDEVLAGMFTENTGRHMLDSGGAYGRNWERNQGRDAEAFLAAPEITLDVRYGDIDVTLDAFHWLRERLEYAPDMQRKFELYVAMRDEPDGPWLVEAEAFAEAHERKYGRSDFDGCVNTYNGDSLLSQVLQYVVFTGPDDEQFIALQVHGGCDVRGGYTAPKLFRFATYNGVYDLYDDNDFELYCTHEEPQRETLPGIDAQPTFHAVDVRGPDVTCWDGCCCDPWGDRGVERVYTPEDGDAFVRCPWCEEPTPMSVGVRPVG